MCRRDGDVLLNIQSTLSKTDTFGTGTKCPSYKESNKGIKERQGPTLSVRFTEVSVKRESTVEVSVKRESTVYLIQVKREQRLKV